MENSEIIEKANALILILSELAEIATIYGSLDMLDSSTVDNLTKVKEDWRQVLLQNN